MAHNLEKRLVVVNSLMKTGALALSLAGVALMIAVISVLSYRALSPAKTDGQSQGQPSQQAATSGAPIVAPLTGGSSSFSTVRSGEGGSSPAVRTSSPAGNQAGTALSEAEIRYDIAIIELTGVDTYYRVLDPDNPNAAEALARWRSGVRPSNIFMFELASDAGGTIVAVKGTKTKIDGMSVQLSSAR